jgi:hypothetical protein
MTRLELRSFNGQFRNRGVVERIRRRIQGRVRDGQCVLLDFEGVEISAQELARILEGWPADRVKSCGMREVLRFPLPFNDDGDVSAS